MLGLGITLHASNFVDTDTEIPPNVIFAPQTTLYWGAWISGQPYDLADPPWDMSAVALFEAHTRKNISILHFGIPWYSSIAWPQNYYPFTPDLFGIIRAHGSIPLVDWASWDVAANASLEQKQFALKTILQGDHDAYIRQWATDAKQWGYPFFLRFDWEMNGDWYPWSESVNGNSPGEYIQAWRHVHDIFTTVGANNVTWVWCPNTLYGSSIPLEGLYPGDQYVDWTCTDVYNFGKHPARIVGWKTFAQIFVSTYNQLITLAPDKPIMIAELGSTELGGNKAAWITDTLTKQVPNSFPQVKAVVWFNWNINNMDWVIESSPSAQAAFASSVSSPFYTSNNFLNLETSPIKPVR